MDEANLINACLGAVKKGKCAVTYETFKTFTFSTSSS